MVDIIGRQRLKARGHITRFEHCALQDTGADVPLISEDLVNKLCIKYAPKSLRVVLLAANNSTITNLGYCKIWLKIKSTGKLGFVKFIVTPDTSQEMILSYKSLVDLGLIPRDFPNPRIMRISQALFEKLKEDLCSEFSDCVSDALPTLPMDVEPLDIVLKEGEIHLSQCTQARPFEYHFQDLVPQLAIYAPRSGNNRT